MQRDSGTYLDEPSAPDYPAWRDAYDLEAEQPRIDEAVRSNALVADLQARLVPLLVERRDFWARYFYRLRELQRREEGRQLGQAARAQQGPAIAEEAEGAAAAASTAGAEKLEQGGASTSVKPAAAHPKDGPLPTAIGTAKTSTPQVAAAPAKAAAVYPSAPPSHPDAPASAGALSGFSTPVRVPSDGEEWGDGGSSAAQLDSASEGSFALVSAPGAPPAGRPQSGRGAPGALPSRLGGGGEGADAAAAAAAAAAPAAVQDDDEEEEDAWEDEAEEEANKVIAGAGAGTGKTGRVLSDEDDWA